jgi:predicted MFS family arabinose efflux permease
MPYCDPENHVRRSTRYFEILMRSDLPRLGAMKWTTVLKNRVLGLLKGFLLRALKGSPPDDKPSDRKKIYVLFTMAVVTALAMMDRNILNILLVPIQRDIGASDTAMGLLTGTAFAVFYCTAAIPIARLVDTRNRRNILSLSLAFWSVATALSGLASTYWHLLWARIGVAAGEASANPAIISIITDHYTQRRRATALGATLIGTGIGVLLGNFSGGLLAQEFGWRLAFFVVGAPGVVMALLMWMTVGEPTRGAADGGLKHDPHDATFFGVVRHLVGIPSLVLICVGKSFVQISTQAGLIWFPAYLIRIHGYSLAETGLYFGLAIAVGAILAAIGGGPIADLLARRGTAWHLRFCVLSMLLAVPMTFGISQTSSPLVAMILIWGYGFTAALNTIPSVTAALALTEPRMRGLVTAIMNFIMNFLGAGLGGFLIGALNDVMAPRYGDQSIRYSLLVMPIMLTLAAAIYFTGSLQIDRDMRRLEFPTRVSPTASRRLP